MIGRGGPWMMGDGLIVLTNATAFSSTDWPLFSAVSLTNFSKPFRQRRPRQHSVLGQFEQRRLYGIEDSSSSEIRDQELQRAV